MNLSLNEQEAGIFVELLHLASRAGGLKPVKGHNVICAEACVYFLNKVKQSAAEEQKPNPEIEDKGEL